MTAYDFLVFPDPRHPLIGCAGLVLEWLGFPRWELAAGESRSSPRAVEVSLKTLGEAASMPASSPALVEVIDRPPREPLPVGIRVHPSLEPRLEPANGLYADLGNYNGIRGIRRPLRVEPPFRCERRRARCDRGLLAIANPLSEAEPRGVSVMTRGEPLVWLDDERPVISREECTIFLGLPLLSILASHMTVPSLEQSFYRFSEPVHHLILLLQALVDEIAPAGVLRVAPWPWDERGVVSVRHDMDRPVSWTELARRERDARIRPTVHVLADSLPNREELDRVVEIGGEIGLHGRWLDAMSQEKATVAERAARAVSGHSCHGGDGDGWQGFLNVAAAHEARFGYTELLSEMHIWPHRLPDPRHLGRALEPIAMPHHLSFDIRRGENDAERLACEIPRVLSNRGLITLMNHPDINFDEFIDFVKAHVPAGTTTMTLDEVAAWWRATHTQAAFSVEVADGPRGCVVISGRALEGQLGAVLGVRLPAEKRWKATATGVAAKVVSSGSSAEVQWTLEQRSFDGFRITAEPDE